MTPAEARELIHRAVRPGETWADLGAGSGTFTRAILDLVGTEGVVWAVDRDRRSLEALERSGEEYGGRLHVRVGDFTRPLELPRFDGILIANALHFVPDQPAVLENIVGNVRGGGKLLLVEYDRTRANPWVPYPVPPQQFRSLAQAVGLSTPLEIGRRPSIYHREMYAAVAYRGSTQDAGKD